MQNSPARPAIDVGAVIDGTYTIEAVIGRGGMGEVFLASHNRLAGKRVAIKTLHAELVGEEIFARFKREADIASQLNHPNIVKVEDYKVLPDGTPYIVYEYLHGESLAQRLASVGRLPVDQTLAIVRQVGSALSAAHRSGIVHRDLKPHNIFLCPSEVEGHAIEIAKVLDFGISKIRGSQTVKTQESSLLGTPQYMAPEQANGQHSLIDERTDIFALGAIAYEMLTGRPAFHGTTIPEVVFKVVYEQPAAMTTLVDAVPSPVVTAVGKAMAKAVNDRYATIPEFIEAMTGVPLNLTRRPTGAMPPQATSGERSRSGFDAFAQTWGSGDGSKPVAVPPLGTPAATAPPKEAPKRTNRRAIIAVGLAIASAAAAGVTYLATQRPEPTAEPAALPGSAAVVGRAGIPLADAASARPSDAPNPPATDAAVAAPSDAAVAQTPTSVPTNGSADSKPAPKLPTKVPTKPTKPREPESGPDDEPTAQKLKDSELALRDGGYDRAQQLANSVITSSSASRAQKAHAYAIRGVVDCVAHSNEERAHIALRQLTGFPRLRKRLITSCQAKGQLMTQ